VLYITAHTTAFKKKTGSNLQANVEIQGCAEKKIKPGVYNLKQSALETIR
jgi:hypothetical protein